MQFINSFKLSGAYSHPQKLTKATMLQTQVALNQACIIALDPLC